MPGENDRVVLVADRGSDVLQRNIELGSDTMDVLGLGNGIPGLRSVDVLETYVLPNTFPSAARYLFEDAAEAVDLLGLVAAKEDFRLTHAWFELPALGTLGGGAHRVGVVPRRLPGEAAGVRGHTAARLLLQVIGLGAYKQQ